MPSQKPVAPPHPHVTVDDVWHGALPKDTQLVAGAGGSRREVVWCTALRARPPAFTPLRGGELLLIDPQVLAAVDSRLTLARLLESLAGQGIAGAAILGRVSPEARRVAEAHGLPVFALAGSLPLDQVEQQVLRFIVDQRAALHERAQDLHRQLSELALAGRGLPALLVRLNELTGVPVVLERDSGVDYVGAGRLSAATCAAEANDTATATRIRAAWERLLATMRTAALVRERGAGTVALISLQARRAPEPRALVEQLHRAAKSAAATPLALGYGAVRSGGREVAAAAREAEQAMVMGRRLFGADSITAFADLGLYRLLYALQPLPEPRAFRDEALERLRPKDRGGVLLQTLEAYLATNGSPTDAAERLHLHRNTVLYRLGRIEDLLGVDLRDAEVRLGLHLALKIGDVLEG